MLSVKDLSKLESKRKDIKKALYKEILSQFSKKIKLSAEASQTQTFLTVPSFVYGYPSFDRSLATVYLMRQLELLGYSVVKYSEFDIYVTWIKSKPNHEDEVLPVLMNLRKTADNYRKKHDRV
jgi:hypothetical protein